MSATPSQRQAITTLDKPLFIQAGAGTGKTFTLTKRLGYGLSAESGSAIPSVENLLTITFTNKAAGELVGRVRAELRERGLAQAALEVDSAWISTIHAMCKNILTEHCFEAGIDVGAVLLSEEQSGELFAQALNEYFALHAGEPQLEALLASFGTTGTACLLEELALGHLRLAPQGLPLEGKASENAPLNNWLPLKGGAAERSEAEGVTRAASACRSTSPGDPLSPAKTTPDSSPLQGEPQDKHIVFPLEGEASENAPAGPFALGPDPGAPNVSLVTELSADLQAAFNELAALGAPDTAACAKAMDKLAQSITALNEFAASPEAAPLSWAALCELLESCEFEGCGNVKKQFKPIFASAAERMADVRMRAAAAVTRENLQCALGVAARVLKRHAQLKRAQGCIDTDDLLTQTYQLLLAHPEIAQEYRERFACVMVDEFQDTDALQVGIIEQLTGSGLQTLCTVGDAQQSIYGFRGADLEVYRSMRKRMHAAGGVEVALSTNFRSHPAILQFVEAIFSSPEFFGGEFLRVQPGPNNASTPPWHSDADPRVRILLSAGEKAGTGRGATSVDRLRVADAAGVAAAFAAYHARGAQWRDMAILMGTTSNARFYLDALREHGIPCIMQGGSSFFKEPEVVACAHMARVLENPADDDALFNVLAGPLFNVSDDELLALATVGKQMLRTGTDDMRVRVSLFDALEYAATHGDACADALGFDALGPSARRAWQLLSQAARQAASCPLSVVLAQTVAASPWRQVLGNSGPRGMAVQANIDRVCDLLAAYEQANGASYVGAAEYLHSLVRMAERGAGGREKPGSMVALGTDAVRIMTIHASKGLEFPIVAVAEFERKAASAHSGEFYALTESGVQYGGLSLGAAERARKAFAKYDVAADALKGAQSPESFAATIKQTAAERAAEEEQRLLYVALTRARDTLLLVAHDARFASTGEMGKGLFRDVVTQLFGDEFPRDGEVVKLGTGALVGVGITCVPYDDALSLQGEDGAAFGRTGEGSLTTASAAPSPVRDDGPASGEDHPSPVRDDGTPQVRHSEQRESAAFGASRGIPNKKRCAKRDAHSSQWQVSYTLPRSRALASYSSLSAPVPDAPYPALRTADDAPDAATAFGSAFHECAQWLANTRGAAAAEFNVYAARVAAAYALPADAQSRLQHALHSWRQSELFAQAMSYSHVFAEYPFVVTAEGATPLEGFIDLLCVNPGEPEALVVDYKTGTSGTPGQLRERYAAQAHCYAQAVKALGLAQRVRLVFVRPEADMEEVEFAL